MSENRLHRNVACKRASAFVFGIIGAAMLAGAIAVPVSAQTPAKTDKAAAAKPAAKHSGAAAKQETAAKPDRKKAGSAEPKKAEAKKPEAKKHETARHPAKAGKDAAKPAAKSAASHEGKAGHGGKYVPPKTMNSAAKPAAPVRRGAPPMALAPPLDGGQAAPDGAAAIAPVMTMPIRRSASPRMQLVEGPAKPPSESDIAAVRRVIEVMRGGNRAEALRLADAISEPLSRKLAEWIVLRFDDNFTDFERYRAFIEANPTWPSIVLFRRRAEATLWQERADYATIRTYFARNQPLTAKGRLALARALLAAGDRSGAQAQVREAWRNEAMSAELESQVREEFGALLTAGDDKARMEERLYANDTAAGLRAAHRLGAGQVALARLRAAVSDKSANAQALLEAVPQGLRDEPGYAFAHLQLLRRADKFTEAAALMRTVTREPAALHNTDEWWIERRLLARKLIDTNEPRIAYEVARDAAAPDRENYRVEQQFTAGWIALRFLNDPATAITHFARIPQITSNPISLARAGYWLGRAYEASRRPQEARRHYESAAQWTTAYYGQIARAKLGMSEMVLYAPQATPAQRAAVERLELVRAAEVLYELNEPNLIRPLMADLGEKIDDVGALVALGEITARHRDARGMLQLGKAALSRGIPFGQYAFPTVGVPDYTPLGPKLDPAIVYSIVRQESAFDPKDVSTARAMGLMQVTAPAGKDTCRRFKCKFDAKRLLHDGAYNVQIGAAELSALLSDYRGSLIMAFAGYNAGRGSVRTWVARYGDPRDPGVDPIDWVELIPFSETRNYVQRVMENLQVYRLRFGGSNKLLIEADLRRGGAN